MVEVKVDETIQSYELNTAYHSEKFDCYDWRGQLKKFIGLLNGGNVLDVGCGNGRDAERMQNAGLKVTGIDLSEKLLEIAKKRVKNARFFSMDMKKLEFDEDEFDGIWCCASLLHVPKKSMPSVLKKFKRVLKPNGVLFAAVKQGGGEAIVRDKGGERFFNYYSPEDLKELLEAQSFQIISMELIENAKVDRKAKERSAEFNWVIAYAKNAK